MVWGAELKRGQNVCPPLEIGQESFATINPHTGFYTVSDKGKKPKRIQDPRSSSIYSVLLYTLTDSTILVGMQSELL